MLCTRMYASYIVCHVHTCAYVHLFPCVICIHVRMRRYASLQQWWRYVSSTMCYAYTCAYTQVCILYRVLSTHVCVGSTYLLPCVMHMHVRMRRYVSCIVFYVHTCVLVACVMHIHVRICRYVSCISCYGVYAGIYSILRVMYIHVHMHARIHGYKIVKHLSCVLCTLTWKHKCIHTSATSF
jgi:hypothetical protein